MGLFKKRQGDKIRYKFKDRVERGEFRGSEIEELVMPDTVRIVAENGFRESRKLRMASLSDQLCEIGAYAFRDCDMLENIVMPGEMHYPDGSNGMIGIGAFEGCGLLREITIPSGVSVINANCFHNCAALETVTLPRSVRAIRSGAFAGCARLKTLNFSVTPELIAIDAFTDTPQLERILSVRKPVLTVIHNFSYGLPEIFQFTAAARMIGVEQTEGDMSIQIDDIDDKRIAFRITRYTHAGGSHVVPLNQPTVLFHEEYECSDRVGTRREEIVATYR